MAGSPGVSMDMNLAYPSQTHRSHGGVVYKSCVLAGEAHSSVSEAEFKAFCSAIDVTRFLVYLSLNSVTQRSTKSGIDA